MPDSESSDSDFIPGEDLKTSLDIITTNWQFVEWKMGNGKLSPCKKRLQEEFEECYVYHSLMLMKCQKV